MRSKRVRRLRGVVALICGGLALALSGCASSLPMDPEGTLDSVRNDTLRVGVTPHEQLVKIDGGSLGGRDVELSKEFAAHLGAQPEFVLGGEESLVKKLEENELDLVVGGISSKTPWSEKVGITRPYAEITDEKGKKEKLVLLVPPGENAFLSELEYFLDQTQEMP
ncbi:transporter substrate-binding domain-containing protein [Glutamicibacter sp. X7]